MTITSPDFWDRVAPSYSQQPISDPDSYARKLAATQAIMRPDMKVLEFGCGTGSTALEHASHVTEITATDVSSAMLKIGKEKADNAGINNVRFEQSGVVDFEAADNSFDMVLALNLIHLLPERQAAIEHIHRLLKPGGYFISSTVCLNDKLWFLRPAITVMQWLGKAPYVSFIGADQVRQEILSAGFSEKEHWTHGRANSLFVINRK